MTPKFYVEVFPFQPRRSPFSLSRPPQQFRWRAKGMNHEILASGESYSRRVDCEDTVEALFGDVLIKRLDK